MEKIGENLWVKNGNVLVIKQKQTISLM